MPYTMYCTMYCTHQMVDPLTQLPLQQQQTKELVLRSQCRQQPLPKQGSRPLDWLVPEGACGRHRFSSICVAYCGGPYLPAHASHTRRTRAAHAPHTRCTRAAHAPHTPPAHTPHTPRTPPH